MAPKRAFVTGATGFVGSHVTRCLVRHGWRVAALVRPGADTWRLEDVLPDVELIEGDLRDLGPLGDRLAAFAPGVAIHLAWQGVARGLRNDPDLVAANVCSSLGVVGAAQAAGCRAWISLGSQAEYGAHNRRIDEDATTNPTTAYGITKLATGMLARTVCEARGTRFVWFRLFSSYGPADDPSYMVPYLILSLLRGERPALTAGEQRWAYLYVDDIAEAFHRAAACDGARGVFNLSADGAEPLRRTVERIRDAVDPSLPLGLGERRYPPDQVMHLEGDSARFRAATGWAPAVGLDEGIARTVAWYRQHRERYA